MWQGQWSTKLAIDSTVAVCWLIVRVARGSGRPAGPVGSGPVRWMSKIYCKILRCLSYYTYNNELNMLHVVFYVYIMSIRRCDKSEANRISVVLALTLVCRRQNTVWSVWSKSVTCKCRPLLCCLRSKMRCRNASYHIAIAHRTLCACNKTTNAGGNHSDCLCLLYL